MNIDTDVLLDSVLLVLVGMAVVFVGLFILMVAATAVVRPSQRNNKTGRRIETPPRAAALSATGDAGRGAIAAMAVALALSMEKGGTVPPVQVGRAASMTQAGAGSTWAAAGREQQMRSRGKVGHKWGRRSD